MTAIGTFLAIASVTSPAGAQRITHNFLVGATLSSNIESYDQGLRGGIDHMIYDVREERFVAESQYHEYGIGFGEELGVIPEGDPVWWMAELNEPASVNAIALTGCYPNQPQPSTAWKIEVRAAPGGEWQLIERGVGGWIDNGRFEWGGPAQDPIAIDAFRVSVFSKDGATPVRSIHFRGEPGFSWVVGFAVPIDAEIVLPEKRIVVGRPATISAETTAGSVTWWRWSVRESDETVGESASLTHTFQAVGETSVGLAFGNGEYESYVSRSVRVAPSVEAAIEPLTAPVMAGQAVRLRGRTSIGKAKWYRWSFGDGSSSGSRTTQHIFKEPGIYRVSLTAGDGRSEDECTAIVRAHSPESLGIPQVHLDTDQKNEQDDQHYLGYAVFSELDILGVNSIHHGGGQEEINYNEILHVLELARESGLPEGRQPTVFRGADERLTVPESKLWSDTPYAPTEASDAILAAARGASPENPVWVVPVGPGTNTAAAILQARDEGLELGDRVRVMWLGGSNDAITHEFNGNNDPWSMYVVAQSGVETWIMPAPVGARVAIDKRTEADWYADHALGQYLLRIVPARNKPLFDPSCLSAIIGEHLGLGWVKVTEPVIVGGVDEGYAWTKTEGETDVRVIREIDQEAMKRDLFDSMKGKPTRLLAGG